MSCTSKIKGFVHLTPLGNCLAGSTPGLQGLALRYLPPISLFFWSARAGEVLVYFSVHFFKQAVVECFKSFTFTHACKFIKGTKPHTVQLCVQKYYIFFPFRRGLLTIYMANLVSAHPSAFFSSAFDKG